MQGEKLPEHVLETLNGITKPPKIKRRIPVVLENPIRDRADFDARLAAERGRKQESSGR